MQYYYKRKNLIKRVASTQTNVVSVDYDDVKKDLQSAKSCIQDLEMELAEIEESNEENKVINTFSNGRYTTNMTLVVYHLALNEVAVEKIGPVLKGVIETLTNKGLSHVPTSRTCCRIVRQMGLASKMQVADVLSTDKDTTLKYDGTSKKERSLLRDSN